MRVWVVVVLALVGGCGSDGPNRGTQCRQLLDVACDRYGGDCQLIPSSAINTCVQSGLTTCCDGDCATPVISTQAEIDTCVADIDAATCAYLDLYTGGTLPASCQGVVRSPHRSVTSALSVSGPSSIGAIVGGLVSQ